jgi:hypothetical protein
MTPGVDGANPTNTFPPASERSVDEPEAHYVMQGDNIVR